MKELSKLEQLRKSPDSYIKRLFQIANAIYAVEIEENEEAGIRIPPFEKRTPYYQLNMLKRAQKWIKVNEMIENVIKELG